MKNIPNSDRGIFPFFLFSITFIVFGFFLILDSVTYIAFWEVNFSKQKNAKLTSSFNIHESFSIKDFPTTFIPDKNYNHNIQTDDKSKHLNHFDLETVVANGAIPDDLSYLICNHILDLHTLPNELYSIKDVQTKKEKFIISVLPFIVQENKKIRINRARLLKMKDFLINFKTLNHKDQRFLEHLASNYSINTLYKHKIDILEVLLESVDEIPNSIALAQAANESGWGTSRFAKDFNALFGEYTFDINNGVIPIFRDEGEKHLVKYFANINESIGS